MKRLLNKLLVVSLLMAMLIPYSVDVRAVEGIDETVPEESESAKVDNSEQDAFLKALEREFNLSKANYKQLLAEIADTKQHLLEVAEAKVTLEEQLASFRANVAQTTERLLAIVRARTKIENEMLLLENDIEVVEVAIEEQKKFLEDYFRIIYEQENKYLNVSSTGDIDGFKLLLADGSIGENLAKMEYMDVLSKSGQVLIEEMDDLFSVWTESKMILERKMVEYLGLEEELEMQREQLEIQKAAKEKLLELTLGQEQIYNQLLAQTEEEQASLLEEVQTLNQSVYFIKQEIAKKGSSFNPDDYLDLLDSRTRRIIDLQMDYEANPGGFIWPVKPKRGISAYFRDSSYVSVFGVQHNAIDIPIEQGSPVQSAANGIVYKAKDNGYGYSYIIVAHGGGFTTIYGHISEILVAEGQAVNQGDVIGLSGGMPGTKGAGYMTTGPHLHFEMQLNGVFVDGLNYMPMKDLSSANAERLPAKYYDRWVQENLALLPR
ncbi:hypothetical protein CVV38_02675 [Candidatus Peregrinibacteria bacterium HGW-Peregrinibacteria-1]|jgi:murein DD-endopeptidase MepM/ murein hydrolase activator NlpD|nr:MAG: hypothetical protein CVV38_02675 [Candidatus Peregrinibacteria bacterium HGW-Peregrinibacteria-1]